MGAEDALDHSQMLTDPAEAADFVAATGVDALRCAFESLVKLLIFMGVGIYVTFGISMVSVICFPGPPRI